VIFFLLFLALGVGKFFSLLFSASSRRFRLPSVVGEILAGVLLGNLYLPFAQNSFLQELGDIGIVLLLFSVGLESSPEQLKK
jgi:Kef-type K+ transport system membrane component KefB